MASGDRVISFKPLRSVVWNRAYHRDTGPARISGGDCGLCLRRGPSRHRKSRPVGAGYRHGRLRFGAHLHDEPNRRLHW